MLKIFIFLVFLIAQSWGYIQHSGAYSSPQYAKKPYYQPSPEKAFHYHKMQVIEPTASAQAPEPEKSKFQEIELQNHNYTEYQVQKPTITSNSITPYEEEAQTARSTGFMATASNFLSGRGGQMLANIARELISRSTGASSQVLSLNLTNLVILVILKALILAVGMFGAGTWGHGYARSMDSENSPWLSEDELALWLGYLYKGKDNCLANAACKSPDLAKKYCGGADILLTASKIFNGTTSYEENYDHILEGVKKAAEWGAAGMECDVFKCIK